MKLKVPAPDLEAILAEAPLEHVRISQVLQKRSSVEGLNWEARMAKRAEEADEDLEQMLEYDVDENGKLVSRVKDSVRARIRMFQIQLHPEAVKKRNDALAAQVQVNIGADAIKAALDAAGEMDRHMLNAAAPALPAAIDVPAEKVE